MGRKTFKRILAVFCIVALSFSSLQNTYAIDSMEEISSEVNSEIDSEISSEVDLENSPEISQETILDESSDIDQEVTLDENSEIGQEADLEIESETDVENIIESSTESVNGQETPEDNNYEVPDVKYDIQIPEYYNRLDMDKLENKGMSTFGLRDNSDINMEDSDPKVNIRKQIEWINKDNGDAKITLNYDSSFGQYTSTKDMNVILIHDKSGSMDVNFGYNLTSVEKNLGQPDEVIYFPIQNNKGYSENTTSIANRGYYDYLNNLNWIGNFTGLKGINHSDYMGSDGWLNSDSTYDNSPCQVEGHYYLLIRDSADTGITATRFVHGSSLSTIVDTDLHHYILLGPNSEVRNEMLEYLGQGRRVVQQASGYYINSEGTREIISSDDPVYFLDVTQVSRFGDKWLLNTCSLEECVTTDRMAMSQKFMSDLVDALGERNTRNKIAYVPFWGDVPQDGKWVNREGNDAANALTVVTDSKYFSGYESVDRVEFTEDSAILKSQINNDFSYFGTNWSLSFQAAIDMLNNRSEEDKKKETLIIFMSDGNPQGTRGKMADFDNPYINGIKEVDQLHKMEGVTVYACGVGVGSSDNTGLPGRLTYVDSNKKPAYARYTADFGTLYETILNRIDEQYAIDVKATDGFYVDVLSDNFTFYENSIDSTWEIINEPVYDEGEGSWEADIPTNVASLLRNSSRVNKVYVRSTKTVYWYIPELQEDGFWANGQYMSFNVNYVNYNNDTGGKDIILDGNDFQGLSYVTNQNPDIRVTLTMEPAPAIVFNRGLSKVTVNKELSGSSFNTDQTYKFVYSKEKQTSGVVQNILGTVNVVVKAGEKSGTSVITGLGAGTYYFYEVDNNNTIISSQVKEANIIETNEGISTKAYDVWKTPNSIRSTKEDEDNINNYLKITYNSVSVNFINAYVKMEVEKVWDDGEVSSRPDEITVNLLRNGEKVDSKIINSSMDWKYTFANLVKYDPSGKEYNYTVEEIEVDNYKSSIKYSTIEHGQSVLITNKLQIADLTITKIINVDEIWWEHGNPIFMFEVSGKGIDNNDYTFYHTLEFTKDYVDNNTVDGKVSLSYTFEEIPISAAYEVKELKVSRYILEEVTIEGYGGKQNSEGLTGYYNLFAKVDLEKKPEGTNVSFYNRKYNFQDLSHKTFVRNVITEKRRNY